MKIEGTAFTVVDWKEVTPTTHPGAEGNASWRTVGAGSAHIRVVEYSPGYVADHWCAKGHVVLILEGELTIELKDGRKFAVPVGDFGWTAILPGLGLLEEFKRPFLYKWNLDGENYARFEKGIRIPIRPFCGVLGVAPAEAGSFDVMPPGKHGGNMDIRHTTAGSRVRLPVHAKGALFSTGDIHAAMGDGEICVCAIECAGSAKIRFGLEKGAGLIYPDFHTKGEPEAKAGWYATTGIASDLMTAAKESARGMIAYLTKNYGLSNEEAYVLCSVAADLRIHEVVDSPNWVVGTMMPLDVFPKSSNKHL